MSADERTVDKMSGWASQGIWKLLKHPPQKKKEFSMNACALLIGADAR